MKRKYPQEKYSIYNSALNNITLCGKKWETEQNKRGEIEFTFFLLNTKPFMGRLISGHINATGFLPSPLKIAVHKKCTTNILVGLWASKYHTFL